MASTTAGRARDRGRGRGDAAERESAVEPFRVTPKLARRLAILGALLLVGFAALTMRLWTLQVLAGPEYAARANAQQIRETPVPAARGAIVDRHGVALVTSAAVTSVDLYPSALPKLGDFRYHELKALSRITHVPLRTIRRGIHDLEKKYDTVDPFVVLPEAPPALVTYLQERASQFPGVSLGQTYVRRYPQGSLAAQLFGIVGPITPSEAKMKEYRDLPLADEIGQSGIEAAFNSYLQGIDGAARVRVDSSGRRRGQKALAKAATPGQTVQLTIDAGLERTAQNALAYGIQLAHNNGQWAADGGAIVAMDPQTGEVLAAASSPTYNPSLFSGRVTQRQLNDAGVGSTQSAIAHNIPLLNRALDAEYPPGSIFKPLTAIAALQEGIISPSTSLLCSGTYVAPEDRGHTPWHNWDPSVYQWMTLPTAIGYSCDTYFYRVGNSFYLLPADRGQPEQRWAAKFGFGRRAPIEIGPQAPRSPADDRVEAPHVHAQDGSELADRPPLEAGRLDPARDRSGRPSRHAAPDGALLLGDRERGQGSSSRTSCLTSRTRTRRSSRRRRLPRRGRSPGSTRRTSGLCRRGSSRGRTRRSVRRTASSGNSRRRSPARRARRKSATPTAATRTSRGGAATGHSTRRRSSCAP